MAAIVLQAHSWHLRVRIIDADKPHPLPQNKAFGRFPHSAAPKFALLVRRKYLAFDALLHTQLRRTFDKSSEDKE